MKGTDSFHPFKWYLVFYRSLKALNYLHSIGIIYCDMKPENLLVMSNYKVKLGDFGVSLYLKSRSDSLSLQGVTPQYLLPEIRRDFMSCSSHPGLLNSFYHKTYSVDTLIANDIYALYKTFDPELFKIIADRNPLRKELSDKMAISF